MVSFEQVKQDLRNLKHIEYSIQTFTEAHEKLQKQYEKHKQNESATDEDLQKLKESMEKLDANGFIKQSILKKEQYFEAISHLEPINQSIIIDSVINGVTYWKIGNKLGFSEVAIKKRVNKSVRQIVDYLNNL